MNKIDKIKKMFDEMSSARHPVWKDNNIYYCYAFLLNLYLQFDSKTLMIDFNKKINRMFEQMVT